MGMISYYFKTSEDIIQRMREEGARKIIFEHRKSEQNFLCIDKAWHAIHYTLTGSAYDVEENDILSQLVLGGMPISEEDMGYGPPRVLEKEKVKQLSEILQKWDELSFRKHFHLNEMLSNNVYPLIDHEDEEQFFVYVLENFVGIKDFFRKAAENEQSIVTFIS